MEAQGDHSCSLISLMEVLADRTTSLTLSYVPKLIGGQPRRKQHILLSVFRVQLENCCVIRCMICDTVMDSCLKIYPQGLDRRVGQTYFTKWAEAYPICNQEAVTVATVFVNEFISRFGTPRQLHTDQGRNFESALFKEVCAMLSIDKTRTTPFHPQSDGMVERLNRTIECMLSMYVAEDQKDWDLHLPCMMMAYRATPQGSSQCSPNLLMLDRETELPIDLMVGKHRGNEVISALIQNCVFIAEIQSSIFRTVRIC